MNAIHMAQIFMLGSMPFSPTALITPHVGDNAVYASTDLGDDGTLITGIEEDELVSYDSPSSKWNERIITNDPVRGRRTFEEQLESNYFSINPENFVTECKASGGTIETITVSAGTFKTCHIGAGDGGYWLSAESCLYLVKSNVEM